MSRLILPVSLFNMEEVPIANVLNCDIVESKFDL